jgi:hypothetical protein
MNSLLDIRKRTTVVLDPIPFHLDIPLLSAGVEVDIAIASLTIPDSTTLTIHLMGNRF